MIFGSRASGVGRLKARTSPARLLEPVVVFDFATAAIADAPTSTTSDASDFHIDSKPAAD